MKPNVFFSKFRVFFQACSCQNEVIEPPMFFIPDRTNSSSYSGNRVRTGPGKPGKSWNFIMAFSRTGKSWIKATGPGNFWKYVKLIHN